jgi:hypothetical protein
VYETTRDDVDVADLVTVKVPVSMGDSAAAASVAATVTVPPVPVSLSVIVTVALVGAVTVYAGSESRVSTTVSRPSASRSSIGVTITVARVNPAGIVTMPDRSA